MRNIPNVRFHCIFWISSFVILYRLFTVDYSNGFVDILYTAVFHIPLVIIVLINYRIIDLYFLTSRYLVYAIFLVFLTIIGIALHYAIFVYLVDYILPGFYFIPLGSVLEVAQYNFVYLIVSLLLKISFKWFQLKENQIQLEQENHRNQMAVLKAQLNPHFLFNSLNNIYAMTSTDVSKGRENIVKLSDALRYMLYKTDSHRVELNSELEYLNNYIELEKLRLESSDSIIIDLPNEENDRKIAPLILLPFIENCFKHCSRSNPEINIRIETSESQLKLHCKNNKRDSEDYQSGGIGLTNAKRRLDLIYESNYDLNLTDGNHYYICDLTINLNV